MRMQFGLSSFQRGRGDLPELPVINMFAEEAPTEETGVVLQSRPGLADRSATMGSGPIKALFRADGVMSGALFGVSGSSAYRNTTLLGTVNGAGPFFIDGYEDRIFIAGGGSLWNWNGTVLAAVPFPDGANVTKVLVGGSRIIALRADAEKFYWSEALSTTITGLNFATAENQPDRLRDALFLDDILILFGATTVEFWPNTGDSELPFTPLEGRVFERGIKATGCASRFGSSFAWITDVNQICVGDPENIITKAGLEVLIEASATARLWTFILEGTEFLALRIDAGTWVYSSRSKLWSQFTSHGDDNWRVQCFSDGVFGSDSDGKTYAWADSHVDAGEVLERRFRAGVAFNSGGMMVSSIQLRTNPGRTTYPSGPYATPTVEMRLSRDAGATWGNWRPKGLGEQGQYRAVVRWNGLGMASQPGLLCEFRVTDPVTFRVSDVLFNEPRGGR